MREETKPLAWKISGFGNEMRADTDKGNYTIYNKDDADWRVALPGAQRGSQPYASIDDAIAAAQGHFDKKGGLTLFEIPVDTIKLMRHKGDISKRETTK